MTTPYTPASFIQINPSAIPQVPTPARGRGAKRGRKPRGAVLTSGTASHQATAGNATPVSTGGAQFTPVQWSNPTMPVVGTVTPAPVSAVVPAPVAPASQSIAETTASLNIATNGTRNEAGPSSIPPVPVNLTTVVTNAGVGVAKAGAGAGDEDGEGEDELLPAMADDDYSAQLSWQSESKDNLKVLMDNFSPGQYDRFEAYRRHALPKQAVRKVIQQTTGQQVSQPVAQIVAGFAKVFVGEIVEKARAVQTRRGETGPLSPDHLREAYRLYQAETGRVGSARAGRGRRLFVR